MHRGRRRRSAACQGRAAGVALLARRPGSRRRRSPDIRIAPVRPAGCRASGRRHRPCRRIARRTRSFVPAAHAAGARHVVAGARTVRVIAPVALLGGAVHVPVAAVPDGDIVRQPDAGRPGEAGDWSIAGLDVAGTKKVPTMTLLVRLATPTRTIGSMKQRCWLVTHGPTPGGQGCAVEQLSCDAPAHVCVTDRRQKPSPTSRRRSSAERLQAPVAAPGQSRRCCRPPRLLLPPSQAFRQLFG